MFTQEQVAEMEKRCQQAQEDCFVDGEINEEKVKQFSKLVFEFQKMKKQIA